MNNIYLGTKINQDNIYFKMHCLYNAKTEIYDRSLTNVRSEYDPTSAFTDCSREIRSASNSYAFSLYLWCKRNIEYKTERQFNPQLWRDSVRRYYHLSAQGWIDLYEYLLKNGEFD